SSVRVYEIIKEVLTSKHGAEVIGVPMADGGEGTVDAFLCALGGEMKYATVKSPLMRDIEGFYGVFPTALQ
ncbi:MAG: glycerate kinase, partial [Clostridia bacterium]|nr:glycerate kinase [Clostridia bacterium]